MLPATPPGGRIFHLMTADRLAAGGADRAADGSLAGDQFERHGFVHCCFREQLTEIATWWFEPDDALVAVELDPARLTADVRLEPSPSRWYPHVYGSLDADAVVACHTMPRRADEPTADLPIDLRDPPPSFRIVACADGGDANVVVRWCQGALDGDPAWVRAAQGAVADGRPIELVGGIVVPATLERPYESFVVLSEVAGGEIVRYDGDGFFS